MSSTDEASMPEAGGPIDDDLVIDAVADFAEALTERFDLTEVLYRVADHVRRVLGLTGAGVTLADPKGRLHPVTGINELTTTLEETEESLQEGPCINAFGNDAVVVARTAEEVGAAWPRWSRAALLQGVRAVAGVPLREHGVALGTVNLYSGAARDWNARELRVANVFADMTSSYVANRLQLERSQELSAQLQRALEARVIIEQAKGVLATAWGCSIDHAFTVLRDHARRTSSSLRAVADGVVHHGFRPPTAPEES